MVDDLAPLTGETIGHWLYVGLLDAAEPVAKVRLVESPWAFSIFAVQAPVVAGPAAGWVLYVSDDGTSSQIRLIRVDGTGDRLIGSVPQVVFAAALAPNAEAAYLILLDRTSGSDQGAFRLSTDGSSAIAQILAPPSGELGSHEGVTLAAVSRFSRGLYPSRDGVALARVACGNFRCAVDVVVIGGVLATTLRDPAILEFYGFEGGIVVGRFDCREAACQEFSRSEAVEVATGERVQISTVVGTIVAAGGDGRPIVLGQIGGNVGNPAPEVWGSDLRTGASRVLTSFDGPLSVPGQSQYQPETPIGWWWLGTCFTPQCVSVVVNLSDGTEVQVADSSMQIPIGAGHD